MLAPIPRPVGYREDKGLVPNARRTLSSEACFQAAPFIIGAPLEMARMAPGEGPGKVEGIRVDVPSYVDPPDFRELTHLCLPFEDGQLCHMGVGGARVFLVHPLHVSEANKILKKYGVEIVGGRQARPETDHLTHAHETTTESRK